MVAVVVIDVLVVIGMSIGLGALAPRWPDRWLQRDPIPLRLWAWETAAYFRRLGVPSLARRLPELGSAFGGESKAALPGTGIDELNRYLVEVRRGEWVHWGSVASTLLLYLWSPWWLATLLLVGVFAGNLPFILILRNNRRRLLAIVTRGGTSS
jgi:hypothetical protein